MFFFLPAVFPLFQLGPDRWHGGFCCLCAALWPDTLAALFLLAVLLGGTLSERTALGLMELPLLTSFKEDGFLQGKGQLPPVHASMAWMVILEEVLPSMTKIIPLAGNYSVSVH